ncbi:hypothetical protein BDN72DRAFT_877507 [Pluteus cervinus]|uniref:Uncharacterized protein n=1 Tax=Pluteus cervinus TaxID=181527 RepID=A0ACD3AZ27_9AGAR|nr:hypothetical protein BDN72DRAFT_877507 [Pluteus cervinus]
MDTLALELLEDILYRAYKDSSFQDLSATLRNCSLVSRQWKEIAQSLLFSEFLLYGRCYNQIKLHQTLISYPHLRDLVKCIWADIRLFSGMHGLDENAVIDLYRQLAFSPRLQHVVLKQKQQLVEPRSFKVFSDLVSSSHLTVLSVYEFRQFPIDILYQCTSVRELHVCRSNFSGFATDSDGALTADTGLGNNQGGHPSRSAKRPRLLHLYFEVAYGDDIALIKWLLHPDCAFDISDLKTFHVLDMSNDLSSYKLARSLAQRVSSSLEELALDPPTRFSNKEYYLAAEYNTFGPLPHLRCLKLSLQQDEFPSGSLLPWTMQFLSGLSHPERLEELQLPSILSDHVPENMNKDHGWEEFDLFLTASTPSTDKDPNGHRKFLNLNRVRWGSVVLSSDPDDVGPAIKTAEVLPSLLPRLHELGILKVSVSNVIGFLEDSNCWYHAGAG